MSSPLPARRTTLRSTVAPLADSQRTRPSVLAKRAIDLPAAPPAVSRAKILKRDVARVVQRTRVALGMSQSEFGADAGTSRYNVDRWERPDDPCAPNLVQLSNMSSVAGLPLFEWALAHHERQVHATPLLRHASDMLRFADLTRAVSNTARAAACLVEGRELTAQEWELIRSDAKRLTECAMELEARAVSELQQRKLRGR